MRPFRLLLGIALTIGLAPGTIVREQVRERTGAPMVAVPLALSERGYGPFYAEAVWSIESPNSWDGGYSALVALSGGELLAASDAGHFLRLRARRGTLEVRDAGVVTDRPDHPGPDYKGWRDIESLTRDPVSGTIWAGLEFTNSIERYRNLTRYDGAVSPPAMADWDSNRGPEAFARLADGRFLVIEEAEIGQNLHKGLVFPADPLTGVEPERFLFRAPAGYSPVDLAAVDDGRVLVLYRKLAWGLPPGFRTALGLVDIDGARSEEIVEPVLLAELAGGVPEDNYEGMALTRDAEGRHVWLISDDNFMGYQRTLLLKLRWDASEGARE